MKFKKIITASDCGFDPCLACENVASLLQDYVTLAFGELGLSNLDLKNKYNYMWVFRKNRIRVYSRPSWNEEVNIETEFVNSTKVVTYVHTLITNSKGELLIEGLVECCALGINDFMIKRLSDFNFKSEKTIDDINYYFESIPLDEVTRFNVSPTLCDMSMHFNNAKSIIKLFESLNLEEIKLFQSAPFEIDIKYNKQALINSNITLKLKIESDKINFAYCNDVGELVQEGIIRKINGEHL